jgi:hypothetical protein
MKALSLYILAFIGLPFIVFAQPANVTGVTVTPSDKQLTVSWTMPVDDYGSVIVVVREGSAVNETPSGDGSSYTANTVFGSGTELGTGNFVVYNTTDGTPSTVTVTGLTNGVTYHVSIFGKDNDATDLWNTGSTGSGTPRPEGATNGAFTSTTCVNNGSVTFAAPASGAAYTYLVFVKPSSAITIGTPTTSAAAYGTPTTDITAGSPVYQHDPAAILVYRGATVPGSIDIAGLANNASWTNFHVAIFNVDGTSYSPALTFSGSRAPSTTIANVTGFTSTAQNQALLLSFSSTLTCADEILIVGREGSAVSVTPSGDGSSYTASAVFGSGTDLDLSANNQYAVYKGTGTSVTVTGLTNGTTYHFQAFIRKGSVWRAGPTVSDVPSSAPVIVLLNPANNGVVVGSTLTSASITFDVNVAKINGGSAGDSRTARLYRVGVGTPVATIDKDNFTGYGTATITIPFNAALVSGNQYYIQIGNNAIEKAPNSTDWPGISDNTTWTFSTAATVVTPAKSLGDPTSNLGVCYQGTFQSLTDIIIKESSVSDFSPGTDQTYSIILPQGFVFNSAITTAPTISGSNISAATNLVYLSGNTIVRFSYTITGTSGTLDEIRITGLQVRYTGTTNTTANIVRIGGSAVQAGNSESDGRNHGTLVAHTSFGAAANFTVEELPGDPAVTPTQTTFSVNARAVKLIGDPPGGDFTGTSPSGVSYSGTHGYIFDPSTVGVGTYPITYTVTEASGQQCRITRTKNFQVIANFINGLLQSYCTTSSPSNISVSQSTIDQHFAARYPADPPGTYTFQEFVYWEPSTGNFTTMPPTNTTFDPSSPVYANTVNIYGVIWMGYRVKKSGAVLPDASGPDPYYNVPYLSIRVSNAPVLSFSLPESICVNGTALNLHTLVSPPPTTIATDEFLGTSVTNPGNNLWVFTPSTVPNATSSPQDVEITYKYTNSSTTCSNTIKRTIRVYPVPSAVPAGNISPGTSMSVCQDGSPGSFNATPTAGTTYNWYGSNPPADPPVISGNIFTPPVDTSTPTTFNFSVTRTINGCESPSLGLSVTVNETPSSPGSSFSRSYCIGQTIPNSDFTVTGSNIKWIDAETSTTISTANPNQPTTAELGITNAVPDKYAFIVTQSVSGCESPPISVTAVVNDLPAVFISSSSDLNAICQTGAVINLAGSPGNGSWGGSATIALINTNLAAGTTQLNPASLSSDPGTYDLSYSYTDANSCSNSTVADLFVLPTIDADISFGTACNGLPVQFINDSQIIPASSPSSIVSTSWNFGDGSGLPEGSGPVEENTNGGKTSGTYFEPAHIFSGVGTFQYTATMRTSDNCVVTVPLAPITINPLPIADFSWANVCSDPVTGSQTQFNATTTNGVSIKTYDWNFHVNNVLESTGTPGGQNPTVNYTGPGKDVARLIVTSFADCIDEVEKPVYIVPSFPAISETNSYTEDFNIDGGFWLSGGTNPSWDNGTPTGVVINRDASADGSGQAFVTNLSGNSNPGEQSWVLSPCFDFRDAIKPVIAFDIWSDTPKGLDGAVLQYNENGNIENDANWIVVGNLISGLNWYDQQGIASKPGNQPSGDVGWTGDATGGKYIGWVRAVFKLDNLKGKSNIVFRVAFASGQGRSEGFAFDNVYIGERSRTVLVESFTNSSADGITSHNDFYNAFEAGSSEIVKIQYHTSFPGYDILNQMNAPLNDARTSFYGISGSPTMRIDGEFLSGSPTTWALNYYDNRILNPSPVKINFNSVDKDGEVVRINASVQNMTDEVVDLRDVHVFTVVLEKLINTSPYLGSSGNSEFIYVAKDFLPDPAGKRIGTELQGGETWSIPEIVWNNPRLISGDQGALAVFVQSVTTREVLQAKLLSAPPVPDLVTSSEEYLTGTVSIYPNPADKKVTIALSELSANQASLQLIDPRGRVVNETRFERGESAKELDLEDLASGVYYIRIDTAKGKISRKIIVLH